MSATIKLRIYNAALGHIGERKLDTLAESREPRHVLDTYYDTVKNYCLEQGAWKFAGVLEQLDASSSVAPDFGFSNAFTKPSGWLRTIQISDSPSLEPALERFTEVSTFWYADSDPLYVYYISNAATAGGEEANWSAAFENYVALRLAAQVCTRLSGAESRQAVLEKQERKALAAARNLNQSANAPVYTPSGSWVTSRMSGVAGSRWDRRS
jgi:hypothetical protein